MIEKSQTCDAAVLERLYTQLKLIRRAEERIAEIYPTDKIKSPVHLSIGQEAISVGVCDHLRASDVVGGTYRGHAVYLAKGGSLKEMMAELYGKQTGCAKGKGGSMHLIAPEQNVIGMSAVVGTTIPVAVGYALALKREGKGRVAVVFMGDGATEEGVFYESINFAKLHRLPILFVCENNGYAIHTPLSKRWAATTICERVAGFGLPTKRIEDGDIFAIRNYAGEAISTMRQNDVGPAFLECLTYRWLEHVGPNEDFHLGYRSEAERHWWKERDAVAQVASLIDPELRQSIDQRIEMQIEEAVRFAEESPFPGPKELTRYVFAEDASCDN